MRVFGLKNNICVQKDWFVRRNAENGGAKAHRRYTDVRYAACLYINVDRRSERPQAEIRCGIEIIAVLFIYTEFATPVLIDKFSTQFLDSCLVRPLISIGMDQFITALDVSSVPHLAILYEIFLAILIHIVKRDEIECSLCGISEPHCRYWLVLDEYYPKASHFMIADISIQSHKQPYKKQGN